MIQFLQHRGYPVPSPACLQQIGDAFRRRVASFAAANHIPVVALKAADRNIEVTTATRPDQRKGRHRATRNDAGQRQQALICHPARYPKARALGRLPRA
jgi:hypothetical protein